MSVLIIDEATSAACKALMEKARLNPIPWAVLERGAMSGRVIKIDLNDRVPGIERPPSQHIQFPLGFRAAISFEQQPSGLFKHLSVSGPGQVPLPAHVAMIAAEFGMVMPARDGERDVRLWLEEFDPKHYAVNLLELVNELQ